MTISGRRLICTLPPCCVLLIMSACSSSPPVHPVGTLTCDQLIAVARATDPGMVFVDIDETGELPRQGFFNRLLGRRTTARIDVRENASDPAVITRDALRNGVVIARLNSRHADRRLKLRGGGDHYWAVAWDGGPTGMSVMVPVAGNRQPECEPLYIKDREEQRPYEARFLSDEVKEAGLILRARVRNAEAVWEACGAMCCCAGEESVCEAHDVVM